MLNPMIGRLKHCLSAVTQAKEGHIVPKDSAAPNKTHHIHDRPDIEIDENHN